MNSSFALAAATTLVFTLAVSGAPPAAPDVPTARLASRHPMAEKAEVSFFALLNESRGVPADVLRDLTTAYAIDPTDGRTLVLLGLDHLWLAAEGDQRDPMTIQHLILAEHFFSRAQDVNPKDDRIASWLGPARLILANVERHPAVMKDAYAALRAAYEKRPAFHSFSLALVNSRMKPDSPQFLEGLAALRQAFATDCNDRKDPACGDAPRWPHNVEGFGLFTAQYEAKAGNLERAAERLAQIKARPEFATWGKQKEALDLEAAIHAARKSSSPNPFAASNPAMTCQGCHGAK